MEGIVEDFPSRCIIVSISPELNSRWLPKNSLPKANTVPHQQWNPAHSRQLSLSAPTSSLNSRSTIFSFLSILAASCAENNLLLNSSLVCVFQFQSEWISNVPSAFREWEEEKRVRLSASNCDLIRETVQRWQSAEFSWIAKSQTENSKIAINNY